MMSARLDMSSFERDRKAKAKAPMVAAKIAVTRGINELEELLDADVAKAFGRSMDWAWSREIFPKGNRLARNPAGVVFSRAPHILETFETGATIKGGRKGMLYIPIDGTPASDKRRKPNVSVVRMMISRFGRPLELPLKDGSGYLLLFKTRTSRSTGNKISAFVKDRKTGTRITVSRGVTWTPMFIVKPEVTLQKRLNATAIIDRFAAAWPDRFANLFIESLNHVGTDESRLSGYNRI